SANAMSELAYQEISYDERIVAFVDILGWSNAVVGQCACPSAEIGWLVHLFQRSVQQAAGHRNFYAKLRGFPGITDDVEVSQFSDSIAISVPIGNGQWVLEEQLRILTDTACQNGFLLRGGIAKGELFHQGSMLFGPALIAAVNMEKAANYPRIILHPSLHDQFHQGSVLLESNGAAYGRRKTWRTDHDGSVFFDYMQPFNAQEIFPDSGRPA